MADDLADLIADEWHQGPAALTERISAHLASVLDAEEAEWCKAMDASGSELIASLRATLGITDDE